MPAKIHGMRRRIWLFAVGVSSVLFAVICAMWLRSNLVRDYTFFWLPRPADAEGKRYLKVNVDSGGGQLELSWEKWTSTRREQLRQQGGIATVNFYHHAFA